MEINKHIIDQRIAKIVQDLPQWFEKSNDTHQKKSKSFVLLSVALCITKKNRVSSTRFIKKIIQL
jgi:hypothetical protein